MSDNEKTHETSTEKKDAEGTTKTTEKTTEKPGTDDKSGQDEKDGKSAA